MSHRYSAEEIASARREWPEKDHLTDSEFVAWRTRPSPIDEMNEIYRTNQEELELEVRRNQLQQEYNSVEARTQRRVQFRERHRQLSRLSANFESDSERDARLAAEIESELRISSSGSGHRSRSNNPSVAEGIPVAQISWTQHWANDQPHVTIIDSARQYYSTLKLDTESIPSAAPPVAVGISMR